MEKEKTPKAVLLSDAFESKFKSIGAKEIFDDLHLRNLDNLKEDLKEFKGNEEKLMIWMRSYIQSEIALSERKDTNSFYKDKNIMN